MNLLFLLLDNIFDLGITVSIVGFGIVIGSLTLLSITFSKLPKLINMKFGKKSSKTVKGQPAKETDTHLEGNVTAAISLALHMYFNELHDEESNIVTIKQIRKTYSPWSSKIYSVTHNWPER